MKMESVHKDRVKPQKDGVCAGRQMGSTLTLVCVWGLHSLSGLHSGLVTALSLTLMSAKIPPHPHPASTHRLSTCLVHHTPADGG